MANRSLIAKARSAPNSSFPKLVRTSKQTPYTLMPWSCHHDTNHSEITAYSEASGAWEIIANIKESAGVDAEETAEFIVRTVNASDKNHSLIRQMMAALETCLECEGLTWEAENEADVVLRRAKEIDK